MIRSHLQNAKNRPDYQYITLATLIILINTIIIRLDTLQNAVENLAKNAFFQALTTFSSNRQKNKLRRLKKTKSCLTRNRGSGLISIGYRPYRYSSIAVSRVNVYSLSFLPTDNSYTFIQLIPQYAPVSNSAALASSDSSSDVISHTEPSQLKTAHPSLSSNKTARRDEQP